MRSPKYEVRSLRSRTGLVATRAPWACSVRSARSLPAGLGSTSDALRGRARCDELRAFYDVRGAEHKVLAASGGVRRTSAEVILAYDFKRKH